jgi:hypothetical protein
VTEYVRPRRKGTGGVLKAKWSDFRVQEVRLRDGRPVRWVAGSANSTGGEAEYLRFVLAKAGFDTLSAVGKLADFLQVRGRAACLARGKRGAGAGAGAARAPTWAVGRWTAGGSGLRGSRTRARSPSRR